MKNRTCLSLLLAFLFLSVSAARASVLVEPLVGYNFKFDTESDTGDEEGNGTAFGGRLGYQNLGLQLGLDYLRSTIKFDDNSFDDVAVSEWAAFIGYEFPILFRAYAGYIFSASGETEVSGVETELTEGTGTKLGVGFTGLPFVVINFEYRSGTFNELKFGGTKTGQESDYKAYLLSLSVPFNL